MVDKERHGPLVSMDVKDFVLTVGARSPTPGGGSVAALTASLVSTFAISLSSPVSIQTQRTQRNRLRCVRCVNENRKKRKRLIGCFDDWLFRSTIPIGWRLRSMRETS